MTHANTHGHLSTETLQAFLEGELSRRETSTTEEHLAACARCSAELDGWRVLFADLGDLSAHRPHEGFHDRVMANVSMPESMSLGARVRDRIGGLSTGSHVAADVLQDFIEGSLAARRAERVEAHLTACSECAHEADVWLGVMRRLDELPSFAPAEEFADRVIAEVQMPEALSLVARLRGRFTGFAGPSPEHVPTGLLQDLVDGALPNKAVARIEAHVADCLVCTNELAAWRSISVRLGSLEQFAPSEHFRERVMEAVLATREQTSVAQRPAWSRLAAAAGRWVPQTREAWAALSGVAVTPVVIVGLMAYAVFSHPTLTVGSLLSFARWQVSDLATAALTALSAAALQNASGLGVSTFLEMLVAAPVLVAGGVLIYTVASAFAVRVLWRNLYAHASSAS